MTRRITIQTYFLFILLDPIEYYIEYKISTIRLSNFISRRDEQR